MTGAGTTADVLKVAFPYSQAEKDRIDADIETAAGGGLVEVHHDATLTGTGQTATPLKVAFPYDQDEKNRLDLAITDAKRVETDGSLTGVGTSSSRLKVTFPYSSSEQTRLNNAIAAASGGSSGLTEAQVKALIPEVATTIDIDRREYFRIVGTGREIEDLTVNAPITLEEAQNSIVVLTGTPLNDSDVEAPAALLIDYRDVGAAAYDEKDFVIVNGTSQPINRFIATNTEGVTGTVSATNRIPAGAMAVVRTTESSGSVAIATTVVGGATTPAPAAAGNIAFIDMDGLKYFRIAQPDVSITDASNSAREPIDALHDRVVVLGGNASETIRLIVDRQDGEDIYKEQAFILVNSTDVAITEFYDATGPGSGATAYTLDPIPSGGISYIYLDGDTSDDSLTIQSHDQQARAMPAEAQPPYQIADYWIVDMSDGTTDLLIRPAGDQATIDGARVMDLEKVNGNIIQVISSDNQTVKVSVSAELSATLEGSLIIVTNNTRQGLRFEVLSTNNNPVLVSQAQAVGTSFLYHIEGANSVQRFPSTPTEGAGIGRYISHGDADARYVGVATEHETGDGTVLLPDVWIDTEVVVRQHHTYTVSLVRKAVDPDSGDIRQGDETMHTFTGLRYADLARTPGKVPGGEIIFTDGGGDLVNNWDDVGALQRGMHWVNANSPNNLQDGLIAFGRSNKDTPTLVLAWTWNGGIPGGDRRSDANKWQFIRVLERPDR